MPDYNASRTNRYNSYQTALQRILNRKNNANQAYQSGSSAIAIEKPQVLRQLLNNYGSRGMAYSTGYAGANQSTESSYATALANLASTRDSTLADADLETTGETNQYNYDIADYNAQEADWTAQQQRDLVAAQAGPGGNNGAAAPATPNLASGAPPTMNRAQFLRTHPELEQRVQNGDKKAINAFLKNHPAIAQAWSRY